MVKVSAVLCGVLACGLVDPCLAGDDKTTTVITYPIYHEWNEGSSNMTVTLGVINADYAWQHANNTLDKRTGITITQVVTTIKNGAQNIATVKAAKDIYDFIAGIIKSKADVSSCAITYGTDAGDGLVYGYAYQTTTTGSNCGSTAEKKTIVDAVEECATSLHNNGASVGCCAFYHGGTWHGHLRLSAIPDTYPVRLVDC